MFFTFMNSARECDITTQCIDPKLPSHSIFTTETFADAEEIIILDGNVPANSHGQFTNSHLEDFHKAGIRIVVDIPDCYYSQDGRDKIDYWLRHSDLVIIHNSRFENIISSHRVMLWPGFPIAYNPYFTMWTDKKDQISFTGSNHRNREDYKQRVGYSGIKVTDLMHSRERPTNSISRYSDYLCPLKESKFAFANGFISNKESIIVGRAIETIASGGLLLYEVGSDLNFFFTEYQDFIPVLNIPDFIEKLSFLGKNETVAKSIASSGSKVLFEEFSSSNFWHQIIDRLNSN